MIAEASRLPLLAAIPALYSLDALPLQLLVVLVALSSAFTRAHMPAQRLILAEVVSDEESLAARANAYLDGAHPQRSATSCSPPRSG